MKTRLDEILTNVPQMLRASRVPRTSMDSMDVVCAESATDIQRVERAQELEDNVGW